MQINGNNSYVNQGAPLLRSNISNVPSTALDNKADNVGSTEKNKDVPTIRELAKTIDPRNMSRNEAAAISAALFPDPPSTTFAAQALVLIKDGDSLRPAAPNDSISNEKFDMVVSLKEQAKFHRQRGLSAEHFDVALDFLRKIQLSQDHQPIDIYT